MKIKDTIKKIIPQMWLNEIKLKEIDARKNKTHLQMEKDINKTYKKKHGRLIDWENPKSFTEKLNVSKLYCSNELKTKLTDKLLVRDWVKEKIGEEYLVPLIGVYDKFEDINFDELPEKFVIKCNHDSGSVTLCSDKKTLDMKKLKNDYDFYLKRNFAYMGYELHYKEIKPKIIIEKYMGDNINDYKFLCFDGKPYYCWIDIDRFRDHKKNVYDLDWNIQPFEMSYKRCNEQIEKPSNLDLMKNIAERLCKGFDHVRVDLYEVDGKTYFGEMTFTNGNGMSVFKPDEWDYKIGELWNLDMSARETIIKTERR